MADSTRSSGNELDHPEVLSRERLTEILCERSILLQDLVDLEKGELVQLFYKFVTPLPQRLHQLRRAKRVAPSGKERVTSQGKMSTIIRLTKRKPDETVDATVSKIARTEHSNIIRTNKRPATSLEIINRQINSVSIHATSPILDSAPEHRNSSLNNAAKPKVVKLNRKTLGLNLNKSLEQPTVKMEMDSALNGGAQKEITASSKSSESGSDKESQMISPIKKKFEKVAVTWP